MPETVAVIGDGAMATVCGMVLVDNGHKARMYSMFPDHLSEMSSTRENRRYLAGVSIPASMELTGDAAGAMRGATLILSAMPCQFIRAWWGPISGATPRDVPICSITKGIENETLLRPTQVLREVLGSAPVAALSGPNIGPELARRLPATAVAASEDGSLAEFVQRAFSTDWFRVYSNTDLVGVELAGATKNVIALAAGALDGLGSGCNAKAALLTRGLAEITRLGVALGARRETFSGLAGLGDLVTTCISPVGRNRSTGERIGRGETLDQILATTSSVVEGVATTRSVLELARRHGVEMPITAAVHAVLFERRSVGEAITELMVRELRSEE
ncbi:MAG: NAD(P)-dependent glycerol-3-phosphate dehydrogenase [Phycisphaerae bacterium]|nr:NAD(P)-dependent glycerol-3-phosphate dehydrogenase [Phycisphaerae bacterium]